METKIKYLSKKEEGYLFGLFEGDGYSYHDKKSRHYVVEFYLNSERDKGIIIFLLRLLKKLELNPFTIKDKRFNCMKIKVNSKKFFQYIKEDYKKYIKNKEFAIGFVSGFLDAEGSVDDKKSSIRIVNTDIELMKTISKILDSNNIHNKLSVKAKADNNRLEVYSIYLSVRFKSLGHISVKAGMPLSILV